MNNIISASLSPFFESFIHFNKKEYFMSLEYKVQLNQQLVCYLSPLLCSFFSLFEMETEVAHIFYLMRGRFITKLHNTVLHATHKWRENIIYMLSALLLKSLIVNPFLRHN